MPNHRIGRLSEDIKRELSALLRELKDPRISEMTSILRCEVSPDGSHCKVHVTGPRGMKPPSRRAAKGLTSAAGYLRRELGSRLKMRKCPELHFIPDTSIAYSAHINELLARHRPERPGGRGAGRRRRVRRGLMLTKTEAAESCWPWRTF